jgi:hypothetical protein
MEETTVKSAKNSARALTALAAATIAVKSASAVTLTLYYGNTAGTSNPSSDGIYIGGGISTSANALGNLQNATQVPANVGGPTTVSIPVGAYVSIAINAVLTGDSNSDAGVNEITDNGSQSIAQPNFMGLAALGIRVPVSANDANGQILQPAAKGPSFTTFGNSVPGYNSFATVNRSTSEPGGPATPQWSSNVSPGDVEMNSGSVGANEQIFGGNSTIPQTVTGMNQLQQFSGASSAYSNSTEFFRGLVYQGLSTGIVTLSPFVDTTATQYWGVLTPASENGGITHYQASFFKSNDTIGTLPALVIDVTGASHSIVNVASSSASLADYGISSGTLAVTGGNGSYTLAQLTGLNVLVNGNQANATQLQTLINAIGGDKIAPWSLLSASTTDPSGAFPGNYNLFFTIGGPFAAGAPPNPGFIGVDLSSSNDPNLVGYSFSAIGVVPEPISCTLLMGASVILAPRRKCRMST